MKFLDVKVTTEGESTKINLVVTIPSKTLVSILQVDDGQCFSKEAFNAFKGSDKYKTSESARLQYLAVILNQVHVVSNIKVKRSVPRKRLIKRRKIGRR